MVVTALVLLQWAILPQAEVVYMYLSKICLRGSAIYLNTLYCSCYVIIIIIIIIMCNGRRHPCRTLLK